MTKLHLGCGTVGLAGWINIDRKATAAVDRRLDVLDGLPFSDVAFIFAEHFIEHLGFDDGQRLLRECHRALRPEGVLRLSTPNLDWVWATAYSSRWHRSSAKTAVIDPERWGHDEAAACDCLELNRAFHAWGHRFLYNQAMLTHALQSAGFRDVRSRAYGDSEHRELRGLEAHDRQPAIAGVADVVILEARVGTETRTPPRLEEELALYRRDLTAT